MTPRIEIAPSILAADFSALGDAVRAIERGGAELVHVDVMDGHFVPNISIGIPVVESLRKATRLPLDVHLMIEAPERYIDAFADAGADSLIVHQEGNHHLQRLLASIRHRNLGVGVAINPATPVSTLVEVLGEVDRVLVMSVNPGFGGQKFLPGSLGKMRRLQELREREGYTYRIEVDGGVGLDTVADIARAGGEILVAGTSVFHQPDPAEAVRKLKQTGVDALAQRV
ncbi:MAG TPA: ribulose-phosphate 3-epimerase [Candidatus Acidoferrales bacterium]|nr:ribulose-phosphate 3-epimerase [Candidatus Acidoferrales bacterium]